MSCLLLSVRDEKLLRSFAILKVELLLGKPWSLTGSRRGARPVRSISGVR